MIQFVRSVCQELDRSGLIVVATVVDSSGSTPRASGAKMGILADGSIFGTVGGGLAEAQACALGKELFSKGNGASTILSVDMTQELAADSEMICGGSLSIVLEVISSEGSGARAYRKLEKALRHGTHSNMITRFVEQDGLKAVKHDVTEGQILSGTVFFQEIEEKVLQEVFSPATPLFILGAGHVSLFTAKVGNLLGFRTIVVDDRADFANRERFPDVDEVVVISSFAHCCDVLEIGEDAFAVIVTRGHIHDKIVLAELLQTHAAYIGMIGSKKKRDAIYEALRAEGVRQSDIERCRCPIGLPIGAQTPEEIAISIGAELVQARYGKI